MELEKYRAEGRILTRPIHKEDLALFKHCAGGMMAVTTKVLNSEVIPLLFLHKVFAIQTTDRT